MVIKEAFCSTITPRLGVVADAANVPSSRMGHTVLLGKFMTLGAMRLGLGLVYKHLPANLGPLSVCLFSRVRNLGITEALSNAPFNGSRVHPADFYEIIKFVINPFDDEHNIVPPVKLLFTPRRPFAVLGEVAKVVINSFNAHAFWRIAHIADKIRIGVEPSVAYGNASAAIVGPSLGFRVRATLFHALPALVAWGNNFERQLSLLSGKTDRQNMPCSR